MPETLTNRISFPLAAGITSSQNTITRLGTTNGLPGDSNGPASANYRLLITDGVNYEIVLVTGGQGTTTLTVTRAAEAIGGVQTSYGFTTATCYAVTTAAGIWNSLPGGITIDANGNVSARSFTASTAPYGANLPGTGGGGQVATQPTPSGVGTGKIWDFGGFAFHLNNFLAAGSDNGVVDATTGIAAWITASSGALGWAGKPAVSYKFTSTLAIPANTILMGSGKRSCKFQKAFNGDAVTMADGAGLAHIYLEGDGANFTGRGIVIGTTDGNQFIDHCRIINFAGACLNFTATTAGSRFSMFDTEIWRTNGTTGSGLYAIVTADGAQAAAIPKSFTHIETAGFAAFDFGGSSDVFISDSFIADLNFTVNSRAVMLSATRLSNQVALTVNGANHSFVGCDILPQITVAAGVSNCTFGPGSFNNLPFIDNSANSSNKFYHEEIAYVPTMTTGGAAPALGNGTLTGVYSRQGGHIYYKLELTLGTTTSLGSGDLRFSLPVARINPDVIESCIWVMNRGGTLYTAAGQIPGAVAYVAGIRDTSGSITFNSPAVFAAGDTIRLAGEYVL